MIFATIDVGSNALRLLLTDVRTVDDEVVFERMTMLRVPVRLGEDAFSRGKISKDKAKMLTKTMCGFREIIDGFHVTDTMACATSALREAKNGDEIVKQIKKKTDIDLKIIDGKKEAKLIYANHIEKNFDPRYSYLYIDVGGGSTEITFVGNGVKKSKSFNVGCIRLKEGFVLKETWKEMDKWLKKTVPSKGTVGIGSGGNIRSLYLLSGKVNNAPLKISDLDEICEILRSFTVEERVTELGLKPDRADIIVPACYIYRHILKVCRIQKIYAPIIGLSDGMVHELYSKHKKKFMD
ncbi:Exopolyphosphatase 1 [Methanimicrococcus hongohii]|uniref:Exopolyphosphatase 1 n=1 Tax=Methanimicrococcus hongohii TaxID=3028295 RepID=A0AA96UY71_9EURY|nr:exopolyphosphatase [Methanimicrococcus sp. Hf6]WNY22784.1 Exopolyphosphatase 1 [Methanimicrococcus sp. Hf6]